MAVNPQYQWVSEHRIVKSTLSVITNVRPDHLYEMGTTTSEIACSLSNTIPFNSTCITSELKNSRPLESVAFQRNSKIIKSDTDNITNEYITNFPFIEHHENLSLALEVCKNLGVEKNTALKGMKNTIPDPGALFIWKLNYKNI